MKQPSKGRLYKITESHGKGEVALCMDVEEGDFGRIYAEMIVLDSEGAATGVVLRKRASDLEEVDE